MEADLGRMGLRNSRSLPKESSEWRQIVDEARDVAFWKKKIRLLNKFYNKICNGNCGYSEK